MYIILNIVFSWCTYLVFEDSCNNTTEKNALKTQKISTYGEIIAEARFLVPD
jgi:hypothetical protein